MVALPPPPAPALRAELAGAVAALLDHHLLAPAKWAAEMLAGERGCVGRREEGRRTRARDAVGAKRTPTGPSPQPRLP